jgi:hypothetical protein
MVDRWVVECGAGTDGGESDLSIRCRRAEMAEAVGDGAVSHHRDGASCLLTLLRVV